jgi:hypothetical protein
MDNVVENLDKKPENVNADSAYGSCENMVRLTRDAIGNYLKYSMFHPEKKRNYTTSAIRRESFTYEPGPDRYLCVNGKYLEFEIEKVRKSATGFSETTRVYRATPQDCRDCRFKSWCTKAESRLIEVSPEWDKWKAEAKANLNSEKGWELRQRRGNQAESPFGQRKGNLGYRRYFLRGKVKVTLEALLYYLGQNCEKYRLFILNMVQYDGNLLRAFG